MWHTRFARNAPLLFLFQLALAVFAFGQAPPVREAGQVRLTVTVANAEGLPAGGLRREHFALFSDKAEQEIVSFNDQPEPASIALLVDTSGSMDAVNTRALLIRAFRDFVLNAHAENEYALLSFNQEPRLLRAWTRDRAALAAGLATLAVEPAKGQTALYDACQRGLELLQRGAHPKRVLLVFGDGTDTASKEARFGKLRQAARESGALIYGINLQLTYEAQPGQYVITPGSNDQPLSELAKETGGWAFIAQGEPQLNAAFEKLALQLRAQYTLGFRPALANGKWQRLELKLKPPANAAREWQSLRVRHRAGFMAVAGTPH